MGLIRNAINYIRSSEGRYETTLIGIAASVVALGGILDARYGYDPRIEEADILRHVVVEGDTPSGYARCEGLDSWLGFDRDQYLDRMKKDSKLLSGRVQLIENDRDLKSGMWVALRDADDDGYVGCEQPDTAGY